ncbi:MULTISPECIES: hypothetical protein [unclassified Pseudomonas]|uniref:hypothetical protein n=1 Tax=unclassified Pseudomonas TaxID=196821 RepID=UPI0015A3FA04|nr:MULTISPECIES: hypothetical protein [unclassified Pseudomonas]NWC92663.1 hypothetical protein [Pseudomonas sp. IPO3779]NWD17377.1 hypothetical protein [Pseudomonas sp. IPO3778]
MKLTIVSGDNQLVPLTVSSDPMNPMAYFAPLTVQVTQDDGVPAADINVGFKTYQGDITPQINGGDSFFLATKTNEGGFAVLNHINGYSVRAMYGEGSFVVNVYIDDTPPVTFNLTVGYPQPKENVTLVIVSGDHQTKPRRQTFDGKNEAKLDPIIILLKDASGSPIAGEKVYFETRFPNPTGVETDPGNAIVLTGADGIAVLNVACKSADGPFYLAVSYNHAQVTICGTIGDKEKPTPANGSRIRDASNGAVYLVVDHYLRHVPNMDVYNNLFEDFVGVIEIPAVGDYIVGAPLQTDTALYKREDGLLFLKVDSALRYMRDEVFDLYGFNRSKLVGFLSYWPPVPNGQQLLI